MRTYVFHFDTAQIHQGSGTALGDFLCKEEPHYAIKEVLAKNTRRDLLLSDSPWDSWEGPCWAAQLLRAQGHAFPPRKAGSSVLPFRIHISQDICHNHQEAGSDTRLPVEEGQGTWAGSCTPKTSSAPGWTGTWCCRV